MGGRDGRYGMALSVIKMKFKPFGDQISLKPFLAIKWVFKPFGDHVGLQPFVRSFFEKKHSHIRKHSLKSRHRFEMRAGPLARNSACGKTTGEAVALQTEEVYVK